MEAIVHGKDRYKKGYADGISVGQQNMGLVSSNYVQFSLSQKFTEDSGTTVTLSIPTTYTSNGFAIPARSNGKILLNPVADKIKVSLNVSIKLADYTGNNHKFWIEDKNGAQIAATTTWHADAQFASYSFPVINSEIVTSESPLSIKGYGSKYMTVTATITIYFL